MLISLPRLMSFTLQSLLDRSLALSLFLFLCGTLAHAQSGIALVQHTSKDAGTTASSSLAFVSANTAGNWIGVVIRAGKSGQVFTVTDTRGNTYHKAVQFNVTIDAPNGDTLGIFYAENIAGGANTITVSDTISGTLRFAILEYSGMATSNSLDVTAAAQGTNASPNSGNVTTTSSGDLLLGAILTGNPANFTAGSGYLIEETVPAEPSTKLIAEDQVQAVAGSISASASLGASDNWGAGLAAFKAAGSGPPTVATPTFSPGTGTYSSAQTVTISSTTSGATICYTTNGTTPAANTPGTCSTGTTLANGGTVTVGVSETLQAIGTKSGLTSSAVGSASYTMTTCIQNMAIGNFTLCGESYNDVSTGANVQVNYSPSPSNGIIAWATWCFNSSCNSSISGVTATIGDNINATESCFVASPHSPFITNANGGAEGSGDFQQHYVWYCPSIPSGVTSFTVTPSNPNLSYLQLNISEWKAGSLAASCSPISACFEDVDSFGQAGDSTGGTTATITTSGSTVNPNDLVFAVTEVPCCSFTASPGTGYTGITVAPSVTPGMVSEAKAATATGIQTATTTWTGGSTPWFGVIVPLKGAGAAPVVATPTFNPGAGTYSSAQTVTISSTTSGATICYTTDGTTPAANTTGTCSTGTTLANGGTVTVGVSETLQAIGTKSGLTNSAVGSAAYVITVATPSITSLNPTSGPAGTPVTITGTNFGASQGTTSTVTFNGTPAAPASSWGPTSIGVLVPAGATSGNVIVTVGGVASNGVNFTVTAPGPSISTLSLTQGPAGATVTITGTNFGSIQGTSTVTFGTTSAGAASKWSPTSIDVQVPAIALGSVSVVVTVGGVASNGVPFMVTPPPSITSINPASGPVGAIVTISGANFGPTVGTIVSFVTFNGTQGRSTNWTDTSITIPVPVGATTGNVVVTIGGVASNGVAFTVTPPPSISGLNPNFGPVGSSVTISGANFGTTQWTTSTVTFNGTMATVSTWSDTSIDVKVPTGATTGNVLVNLSGVASSGVNFTVTSSGGAPITLVQHNSKDAGTTTSSTLAFNVNNAMGNWIAVVIRAGKSGQVFTVTDSRGNAYRKAIQFNETVDGTTLGVFYAENIFGGPNTITVSDTILGTLRFAILEYSGVAIANSLDGAATAAQGTSASPNSGNLTTAANGDLLLGEIWTANSANFTAGSGYLIEETVPAEPSTKLIVEDQVQAIAGSTSASASLGASDNWGAALAAFKSASSGPPPPISVSVLPTSASVVKGLTQGFTATVKFDVQNAGVSWSLSGAGCSGNACGTLSNVTSTSVTYTAPPSVPNPATVSLTATSVTDHTKSAPASITVLVSAPIVVTVSPKRAALTMSQTQQLTATVANDPQNLGVSWAVDGSNGGNATTGTITSGGLFTPGTQPGVHTVTATSNSNASVSASATVAVTDLAGVFTYHSDNARTGQNLKEYALTTATVSSSMFGQLFSCPVDGYVYAEPLYVANLTVGAVKHNVVYIATEHDSVYGFDADSASCMQLWKTGFLGANVTTMPWQDTGTPTNDIFPEIGITSTPVIDPATNTIYVEAKTKETVGTGCSTGSPCFVHRLHALDITTGAEKFGGPVVISTPNFDPLRHFNRPALLLANSTIYIGFGSHGDFPPWYGWLFGYDPTTLVQKFVFSTTDPTGGGQGASIWSSGAGPAADANGNIYVTTGNGAYDGMTNFSESVLKISPTGSLLDWFTPFNRATLDANDIDMGSAGTLILPDAVGSAAHSHLALATGKIAILYLLDQANMGKFTCSSCSNNDVQEVIPVPPPNTTQLDGGNYGVPAYWNGNIYTTGQNYPLSQFKIANGSGSMSTPAFAVSTNTFPPRGATPAVSASGSTNGIVWILDLAAWPSNGNAILDAYDATNVSNLLYSSPASGTGTVGPAVKFTVPTVANGKVYIGTETSFTVFGLLPN